MTYMNKETIKALRDQLRKLQITNLTYEKDEDYFVIHLADHNMGKLEMCIRFMSDISKDEDKKKECEPSKEYEKFFEISKEIIKGVELYQKETGKKSCQDIGNLINWLIKRGNKCKK